MWFLKIKIYNSRKINQKFSIEFFEKINDKLNIIDASYSNGRESRAYHAYIYYDYEIPKEYRYFNFKTNGGDSYANYCPISVDFIKEMKNIYYAGHCSEKGGKNYSSAMGYKSRDLSTKTGKMLSSQSFCVLSAIIKIF